MEASLNSYIVWIDGCENSARIIRAKKLSDATQRAALEFGWSFGQIVTIPAARAIAIKFGVEHAL